MCRTTSLAAAVRWRQNSMASATSPRLGVRSRSSVSSLCLCLRMFQSQFLLRVLARSPSAPSSRVSTGTYSVLSWPFFTTSSEGASSSVASASTLPLREYTFRTGGLHMEPPRNMRKSVVRQSVGDSPCGGETEDL